MHSSVILHVSGPSIQTTWHELNIERSGAQRLGGVFKQGWFSYSLSFNMRNFPGVQKIRQWANKIYKQAKTVSFHIRIHRLLSASNVYIQGGCVLGSLLSVPGFSLERSKGLVCSDMRSPRAEIFQRLTSIFKTCAEKSVLSLFLGRADIAQICPRHDDKIYCLLTV